LVLTSDNKRVISKKLERRRKLPVQDGVPYLRYPLRSLKASSGGVVLPRFPRSPFLLEREITRRGAPSTSMANGPVLAIDVTVVFLIADREITTWLCQTAQPCYPAFNIDIVLIVRCECEPTRKIAFLGTL